jgi:hypothetical protein
VLALEGVARCHSEGLGDVACRDSAPRRLRQQVADLVIASSGQKGGVQALRASFANGGAEGDVVQALRASFANGEGAVDGGAKALRASSTNGVGEGL